MERERPDRTCSLASTTKTPPTARRLAGGLAALLAVLAWLAMPHPVLAVETRQGDRVIVRPDETITDDLYAAGGTINIQGRVVGDLVAAGESISISGSVGGDVMSGSRTLTITGPVGGSVRAVGQSITIAGPIGEDVVAASGSLDVQSRGRVGRDLYTAAGTATVAGPVGRSIVAGTESLTISAPVGGDVRVEGGSLTLRNGAAVQGNVAYASRQEATVEPGATVSGTITRTPRPEPEAEPSPPAQVAWGIFGWLQTLIGLMALGLLLVLLFPAFSRRAAETLRTQPWISLGLGFALLVAVPIGAALVFLLGLLVGGWWLGLGLLALWLFSLPLGYVVAGLFLGRQMLHLTGRSGLHLAWVLLAGLALLTVLGVVPVLGWLATLVAITIGLGALARALVASYRATPSAGEPTAWSDQALHGGASHPPVGTSA